MELKHHTLNEKLKRLEPIATLCQYCNGNHSGKMDRNYFVPLYSVTERTTLIVYNSVKFNKVLIGIPRCNECFITHQKSNVQAWVGSIIFGIIVAVLGFIEFGAYGILLAIGCFVFAMVAPLFLVDVIIRNKGILTQKKGAKKDPLVQDMVIAGWSLNPPTA